MSEQSVNDVPTISCIAKLCKPPLKGEGEPPNGGGGVPRYEL